MRRRDLLLSMAGGFSASVLGAAGRLPGQTAAKKTQLGVVQYCLSIHQRAGRAAGGQKPLSDPAGFLEYCHQLGAGGIQVPLGVRDGAYCRGLRQEAEAHGMFIEGIMGLPRAEADLERFEAQVRTAKQAGARAARVVMIPGRRYERFHTAEEFRELARRGLKSLQLAQPVAARHRLHLAVENHKDQRIPEMLEVLKGLNSEYVGACVDTGNSLALLEDPIEVVEAYAPWAHSVHLKDQAVREYEHGFLLADTPLGEGFLDLKKMVAILRSAKPDVRFSLELITRDPLKVPCLTDKYWATFAEVSGRDLARTLRLVRDNASPKPLPRVSHLPLDEQVGREQSNIRESLAYAKEDLGL